MCFTVKIKWMPYQDLHLSYKGRVTSLIYHIYYHMITVHITLAQGLHCFAKASVLCMCMYACICMFVCVWFQVLLLWCLLFLRQGLTGLGVAN